MAIKFTPVRYGVLCFLTGRCLMCCTALLSPASRRRPSSAQACALPRCRYKTPVADLINHQFQRNSRHWFINCGFKGPIRQPFAEVYFILGTFIAEWNYNQKWCFNSFSDDSKLPLCLQHAVKMLRFSSTCCIFHERHAGRIWIKDLWKVGKANEVKASGVPKYLKYCC